MSKMILERDVESRLVYRVEQLGGLCLKFHPDSRSGMPDRLLLLPGGITLWVETKKPKGGKLSPLQKMQHVLLRRLGQKVEVAWTMEQVDALTELLAAGCIRRTR